ncbi:MAG: hypothetical protein M5U34_44285 [Chloroflexi bacterium]|nr:hypothetical protein [Chloroflexota bacterium]
MSDWTLPFRQRHPWILRALLFLVFMIPIAFLAFFFSTRLSIFFA